jgi:hypothetical protein
MCGLFQVTGIPDLLPVVDICLDDLFFICTCSTCVMCHLHKYSRNLAALSNSRCQNFDMKHFLIDDAQL